MVSFLFTARKNNDDDVHYDDRVCLHVSVGDPCCSSCNHHQQQFTTNNNKRKRDTLKNKKEEEELKSSSVCLHLLLSSPSCIPTCIHDHDHDDHDQWEMKKVLEKSDVCLHLSRLLLKKDVAQQFIIPVLMLGGGGGAEQAAQSKDGIQVQVRDVDTDSLHTLVFKIWSSAKSHIFSKRWVKDFVLRRDLKKGDQIGFRWDQENRRFDFTVLRQANKD
ncbi:B3 domain-containing protein [Trifolium repens]|nr:B3 domain-containing protein [Trifolium repens]